MTLLIVHAFTKLGEVQTVIATLAIATVALFPHLTEHVYQGTVSELVHRLMFALTPSTPAPTLIVTH